MMASSVFGELDVGESSGHSRDYHLLHSNDAWKTLVQAWEKDLHVSTHSRARRDNQRQSSDAPSMDEIKAYIASHETAFEYSKKELIMLANRTAVLTGRLKSASSIDEKLVRKNLTLDQLTDVIGLRLTCQTVDEANRIKTLIEADTVAFNITEVTCYGMCPNAGKYRLSSGYRRIHLIIFIKDKSTFYICFILIFDIPELVNFCIKNAKYKHNLSYNFKISKLSDENPKFTETIVQEVALPNFHFSWLFFFIKALKGFEVAQVKPLVKNM